MSRWTKFRDKATNPLDLSVHGKREGLDVKIDDPALDTPENRAALKEMTKRKGSRLRAVLRGGGPIVLGALRGGPAGAFAGAYSTSRTMRATQGGRASPRLLRGFAAAREAEYQRVFGIGQAARLRRRTSVRVPQRVRRIRYI